MTTVLPDVIAPGLRVLFVGTAVGSASARARAYYAGPGNEFWPTLHTIGLTPRQLRPDEYATVLDYRIGLTDVCKIDSGSDAEVGTAGFDVRRFTALIAANRPALIGFNGKGAARAVLGVTVGYGPYGERLAGALPFVLPSTSGAARGYWDLRYWKQIAEAAGEL